MSQCFKLQLATTSLISDAEQIGVAIEQLHLIEVSVDVTLIEPSKLKLTYYIRLPDSRLANLFNWSQWQQRQVKFTDYLWEQTCLECFIAGKNSSADTTDYIEINASPSGRYALYHFSDYRQPDCMPPMPLYQANSNEQASIDWINHLPTRHMFNTRNVNSLTLANSATVTPNCLSKLTFTAFYDYSRSFTIDLEQLPASLIASGIEQLHPCVILYFDNIALYFAPKHATPPDFHQRQYWTSFKS